MKPVLTALGILCALGSGDQILPRALKGDISGMKPTSGVFPNKKPPFGYVKENLPLADGLRCNQLLLAAYKQIKDKVEQAKATYGAERIGLVIGTSNTGVEESQKFIHEWLETGNKPAAFRFEMLELGMSALFLKKTAEIKGPAWAVSTACSSSAKAFVSARRLLELDLCDAVLTGGADSFCQFALHGFDALQSLDEKQSRPMRAGRAGINLGEGAALFLMEKTGIGPRLLGAGESSDAYHLTAPDPTGNGAQTAMMAALKDAGLTADEIDFINLHGTGTEQNDAMESKAVFNLFADRVPAASTKPLTGHTLGASGAIEAGLSWLMLRRGHGLIPHVSEGKTDFNLSPIKLSQGEDLPVKRILSNSFAFGGSNAALILGNMP